MKILFLSFYFEPDLGAGSFRNTALISEMLHVLPDGGHIDVMTTLPTRYSSFEVEAETKEQRGAATVYRIPLPNHRSGILDQSKAFSFYASSVLRQVGTEKYDLIYASSSRLMTAALAAHLSRKLATPLYLDIRDIFVDTINDILPKAISLAITPVLSLIESYTLRSATKVNLVSPGFEQYFSEKYSGLPLSFYTNGIDDEFLDSGQFLNQVHRSHLPEVLYAGNIGEGQGLHNIIPALAKHYEGRLKFKIIGDGGRKNQLEEALEAAGLSNVELHRPVGRYELIRSYQSADILFMHLNDHDAFLKVLPSKIFEYAALGKPIWAGVSGYSASFLDQFVTNSVVFSPCDVDGAVEAFKRLSIDTTPRADFVSRFSRAQIMREMAMDVLSYAGA